MEDQPTQPISSVPSAPATQQQAPVQATPTVASAPVAKPAVMDVIAPQQPAKPTEDTVPQPVTPAVATPPSESAEEKQVPEAANDTSQQPTTDKQATAKTDIPKPPKQPSNTPVGAILFAIIVLVVLSVAAVMVYQKG